MKWILPDLPWVGSVPGDCFSLSGAHASDFSVRVEMACQCNLEFGFEANDPLGQARLLSPCKRVPVSV